MPNKEFQIKKAAAQIRIKKVLAHMAKDTDFDPDNKIADKAIAVAVEILELPGAHAVRLQAAKILLEYTQKKPQTATAVTLKNAEAFLDDIHNDTSADSNS